MSVDEKSVPPCGSCGKPGPYTITLNGRPMPACLRHLNHWRRPRAALAATGEGQRVLFWCPGCNEAHQVYVGTWSWNGRLDLPTFTPSVLIRGNQWPEGEYPQYHKAAHSSVPAGGETVCHTFVTDGRIQFLGDCTHALAGQTVDLPEWPPANDDGGAA